MGEIDESARLADETALLKDEPSRLSWDGGVGVAGGVEQPLRLDETLPGRCYGIVGLMCHL